MKIGKGEIICGDCLEEMQKLDADSIDLIVTDPPYGYSFMNKAWDKGVPKIEIWKECLRVLKPGAFAFIMSAPRQDVQGQMIANLHAAGFELAFTPLYWTYASGFPKAMNISKAVDKRLGAEREVVGVKDLKRGSGIHKEAGGGWNDNDYPDKVNVTLPSSEEAKALDGSYAGFQPKPAVEIILVAMKPLSEKTYVDQAMKNKKGITWLDDCRVPFESNDPNIRVNDIKPENPNSLFFKEKAITKARGPETQGRFPANLLVSDDVLNDGKITKAQKIDGSILPPTGSRGIYGKFDVLPTERGYTDSGSFSRYFSLDAWASRLPKEVQKTFPFLIVPKASSGEKNENLDSFEEDAETDGCIRTNQETARAYGANPSKKKNTHPTVKPLQLMQYLVTLGSRQNDMVLDPFIGSGTTGLACESISRKWIGIELSEEYVKIAESRLSEWKGQTRL